MKEQKKSIKAPIAATGAFAVASVLFSSHAGGGFATGNQATQYFVGLGMPGIISAIIAMALLSLTIRECMIMYNTRKLTSYKELFQELYHPMDKLYIVFEIYFHIMVVMAVGAVIAGAASMLNENGFMAYPLAVLLVGAILLVMTIFGAQLVSKASIFMSIGILVSCAVIFIMGIRARLPEIAVVLNTPSTGKSWFGSIFNAFTYAGFQAVVIPTMIACGKGLKSSKKASKAMAIAFIMNSIALVLSVVMLLGWHGDFVASGKTTLPSLFVSENLGHPYIFWFYNICLFLCFISTGVTTIYGFVSRFEHIKILAKVKKPILRRIISSALIMLISMSISLVGLDKIVKYGYGYCGYLGIAIIIIPFLTVGYYKNRKFLKENPETKSSGADISVTKTAITE